MRYHKLVTIHSGEIWITIAVQAKVTKFQSIKSTTRNITTPTQPSGRATSSMNLARKLMLQYLMPSNFPWQAQESRAYTNGIELCSKIS
ncbi:MAG: hypothetical protein DRO98_07980 [Archaeoglobales archaeon]|nr:MAG: hypothetical protein DRO98_07980 [Archaeoglobales archaeon]